MQQSFQQLLSLLNIRLASCLLCIANNQGAGIGLLVLGDFGETSLLNPFIDVFSTSIKKNLEKVLTGLCRRYGKNHNDLKYHQMFNSGTECPGIQIINAFSSIKNNVKENLN